VIARFLGCLEHPRRAQNLFTDADEAVGLGAEVVRVVEPAYDLDHRIGGGIGPLHLRNFPDRADGLAELDKLLDPLEDVEWLQLARAARRAVLELTKQALAPLLRPPVELPVAKSATTEHVVEKSRCPSFLDCFRASSSICGLARRAWFCHPSSHEWSGTLGFDKSICQPTQISQ
jgi:hypothetical protein